jgi:type VI secretion system secreted protein VgrG
MIGAQPQERRALNPPSRRALTEGEIALAKATFGARIDYGVVAVRHRSGGNPVAGLALLGPRTDAVTLIRTIFFKTLDADFSTSRAGLFLHEMTHVWQYQALGPLRFYWRYLRELLAARLRQGDLYLYERGKTAFAKARLEAQAQMVQDYYEVRAAAADPERLADIGRSLAGSGVHGL